MTTKTDLRTLLQSKRDMLSAADRARFSDAITDRILALDAYRTARTVMAYMTFGSEFMTGRFVQQVLDDNKHLVLPKVRRTDPQLSLHVVSDLESDLADGAWSIREPDPDRCGMASVADIDFILVPGLGFTARGGRLGYGRGYYDRLLMQRDPHTALVAAAYEIQMVDVMPMESHDVPIELIVTENGMYRSSDAVAPEALAPAPPGLPASDIASLQRAVQGAAPFESLPANLAARVAQLGRAVSYAAGETIYDVSAPAEALYLVLQGEVEHTFDAGVAGTSDPVRIVGAGGVFGWSALLKNQHGQDLRRRLAKAASRSRSEILVIPAEPLMELLQSAPDAKQRVVRSMLDMVRDVYGFAGFVKVHDHFVPARLSSSAADGPKDYDTFAF